MLSGRGSAVAGGGRARRSIGVSNFDERELAQLLGMHWTVGATLVLAFIGSAWQAPALFVAAYPYSFAIIFAKRVWDFSRSGDLWFLFDYCYFAHIGTIWYLWYCTHDSAMVIANFLYRPSLHVYISCTGFAAHGVWAWRNSIVFDDPQRLTSTWLHMCPNVLMYLLRFHSDDPRFSGPYSNEEFIGTSVIGQACFAALLLAQTTVVMWVHTLLRSEAATGITHVATAWCGVKKTVGIDLDLRTKALVVALDLLYGVVSSALAFVPLQSERAHVLFIVTMSLVASWNGYTYARHVRRREAKDRQAA